MAPLALVGFTVALLLIGCDVKQPTPETGSTIVGPVPALSAPAHGAAAGTVRAPASTYHDDDAQAVGERSIRLFGRGVSRQRQTRV